MLGRLRDARQLEPPSGTGSTGLLLTTTARDGISARRHESRVFYGWPMLVGLSISETVSWGVLYYSFSVVIRPIEQEMGWTRPQVTGAFSLALLVAGVAAVPIGHWLDARGARGLMTAGSVLGAVLLSALATVRSLEGLYAVWCGLGLVMAMVLYEPAFAVVATWFVRHRDRALTVLTLFGGLASTLLVPLATWLLEVQGWRGATSSLAAILACTTIPVHALLLRKDPAAVGLQPDGDPLPPARAPNLEAAVTHALAPVIAEPRFWALTAALMLASLVTVATSVHLVPYLLGKGLSAGTAAGVLGLIGLLQLPGRLVFGPVRRQLGWQWTAAAVFLTQACALAVLARTTDRAGLALFACLFGLGNGVSTLLRASTLAELYGASRYGRVGGIVSLFSTLGRASGPVLASLAYATFGGYEPAFAALVLFLALATALVLLLPAEADPLHLDADLVIGAGAIECRHGQHD
jgi:MFS family permease